MRPSIFSCMQRRACALLALLVVSLLTPAPKAAIAQGETPRITITGINVDNFPNVQVSVYGENLGVDWADVPITLLEDNVAMTPEIATEAVGAQTLLVIDTYAGIQNPGMTGASRLQEVLDAVSQLTEEGYLLADKDWLAFVSFENSGDEAVPQVFSPWSRTDHQKVINSILQYASSQIETAKPDTPLFDLLFTSIHYFDDQQPPSNLVRSIVVFSNGVDNIAVAQKEDLIRLANERNVRIHTVQFGPTNDADAQQILQNLSLNTGGRYIHLVEDNALLEELWTTIQASEQQILSYRSTNATPREITVAAQTGTRDLSDTRLFPAIGVRPPEVTIVQPRNATVTKNLPGNSPLLYNTPVTDLEPKALTIQVAINWPDNFARNLARVEYSIADQTIEVTEAPFDTLTFPIESLDQGEYTLRVTAVDELGLTGTSNAMPLSIIVDRPAPPNISATATAAADAAAIAAATATVEANATAAIIATAQAQEAEATRVAFANANATAQAQAQQLGSEVTTLGNENTTLRYLTYGGYAVALLAFLFALFVFLNPRTRKRATEIATGTVARFTEFWSPNGAQAPTRHLRARLVPISGEGLQPLNLYGGSARIGRDASLATLVVNDPRVSRYHCRISEESDGSFRIWDEGSTSGTYVNSEMAPMTGQAIKSGDLINFGPVQYRFEMVGAAPTVPPIPKSNPSTDATQVFVLEQPKPSPVSPTNHLGSNSPSPHVATNPQKTEMPTSPMNPTPPREAPPARPADEGNRYTRPLNRSADATQIGPIDDNTLS